MQVSKSTNEVVTVEHELVITLDDEGLAALAGALKSAKRGVRFSDEKQFAAIQQLRNAIDNGSRVTSFR